MPTTLVTLLLIVVVIEAIALLCLGDTVRRLFVIVQLLNDRVNILQTRKGSVDEEIDILKARLGDLQNRISYVEDELDREH